MTSICYSSSSFFLSTHHNTLPQKKSLKTLVCPLDPGHSLSFIPTKIPVEMRLSAENVYAFFDSMVASFVLCACLDLPIIPFIFAISIVNIPIASALLFPSPRLHPPICPSQKGIKNPLQQMICQNFHSSHPINAETRFPSGILPSIRLSIPFPSLYMCTAGCSSSNASLAQLRLSTPLYTYIHTYKIIGQIYCPS